MARDQYQLHRRLQRARRSTPERRQAELAKVATAVEAAELKVDRRRAQVPEPRYPAGLPIVERRNDLLTAVAENQVVVQERRFGLSVTERPAGAELGQLAGDFSYGGGPWPRRTAP